VVQPRDLRRKKLFLADMDSTMIGQECIDELADSRAESHVAAYTETRHARRNRIRAGAARAESRCSRALPVGWSTEVLAKHITLTPGGRELRRHHARPGRLYVPRLRRLHAVHRQGRRDDRLPGKPRQPAAGRGRQADRRGRRADPGPRRKLATLVDLLESFDLDDIDTLVVGDGANDLGMIERAGLGVAYHAKPRRAAAGARIDYGDLTALLYAQGYRRDEFVTG